MRKYFIVDGFQRKGPYTIQELVNNNVTPDSLIWTFTTGKETPASEITELQHIFSADNNIAPTSDNPPIISEEEINAKAKQIEEADKKKQEEYLKIVEEQKRKYEEELKKQNDASINLNRNASDYDENDNKTVIKEKTPVAFVPPAIPTVNNNEPEQIEEPQNITENIETTTENKYQHTEYSSSSFSSPSFNTSEKPKTYLAIAIITTLFCCLPLGIASIVFSSQVEKKYKAGDITGAQIASKNALIFSVIAIVTGVLFLLGVAISS